MGITLNVTKVGKGLFLVQLAKKEKREGAPRGRWVPFSPDGKGKTAVFVCSACGTYIDQPRKETTCGYEYCPRCGASMLEGQP